MLLILEAILLKLIICLLLLLMLYIHTLWKIIGLIKAKPNRIPFDWVFIWDLIFFILSESIIILGFLFTFCDETLFTRCNILFIVRTCIHLGCLWTFKIRACNVLPLLWMMTLLFKLFHFLLFTFSVDLFMFRTRTVNAYFICILICNLKRLLMCFNFVIWVLRWEAPILSKLMRKLWNEIRAPLLS